MGLLSTLFKTRPDHSPPVESKQFGGTVGDLAIASFTPGLVEAVRLYELGSASFAHIYRTQPAVYTIVEFLAWQISQIGIKVFRRRSDTDRQHLAGHELERLLESPIPGMTYERFLHATVADLCVFGNAYWLKQQGRNGLERQLTPVPPFAVTPRGGNLVQAEAYDISIRQTQVRVGAEEMVHFRRYNPDDLRVGVSPLEPLRRILAEEAAASAHREGFWKNSARNDRWLIFPKALSDEARRRLREDIESTYAGHENAGKLGILEEDPKVVESGFSPKDAEFLGGRKLALETVARAYNIPLPMLGLTDTATYASQREFHRALYQDTLGPWLKMLQGEIEAGVLRWFERDPDVYIEFNLSEKLRGSFEEQAAAIRQYVGVPIMGVDEARPMFNLPPTGDPDFAKPVKPANVIYGEAGSPGEAPMPEAAAGEPEAAVIRLATKSDGGEQP